MNKFFLMGRITKDLEINQTSSHKQYLRFSVAVNRRKKEETDFFNCLAWEKQAEFIQKYFVKGSQISIVGRLQNGSYEKNGTKFYTTDVIVEEIYFCGKYEGKNNNTSNNANNNYNDGSNGFYVPEGEDTLPF